MSVIHISRSGKTYRLHVTVNPKGKEKFFFSTKPDGVLAHAIPEGYEVYETINAQVLLRRITVPVIRADELALVVSRVDELLQKWTYKAEIKKNMIVIHETQKSDNWADFAPWIDPVKAEKHSVMHATYMPVMRFVLVEKETRLFRPERFCFRGSVDDWIELGLPDSLKKLSEEFIQHLGKDSFYDLM